MLTRHEHTQPNAQLYEQQRYPALNILLADNDLATRSAVTNSATEFGFAVSIADSIPETQFIFDARSIDLLLLDLSFFGAESFALLEEVRARSPKTVIVVMTAVPTVELLIEAMHLEVFDCLIKPFAFEELAKVLERSAQRRSFDVQSRALRDRLRNGTAISSLVGRSPAMEKVYRIISKVAFTTHPVLILGESGTGKELAARCIHSNGPNASKPFVPVDCSALAPTLIESELFGYVRGAFTGATRSKTGLLASAKEGTIFLDEIGELPLDLQGRLLRVMQEREVRPVGSTQAVPIAARVLSATNRDLASMVETGRFRKDLFYRLNVVNIRLPPLRDRRSDVLLLTEYVLERQRAQNHLNYSLGSDATRLFLDYEWPGNVRELEHALEHACALSSGPVLYATDFPTQIQNSRSRTKRSEAADGVMSIAELERRAIFQAIRQFDGDKLMAARVLGIGKTTLYRKLKEYKKIDGFTSNPEK